MLAVGDRIENRRVGAGSLRACGLFTRLPCEQRRHGCGQPLHQRDFDEDQRLAGKRGMEECEAPAVGRKAPPPIVPTLDLIPPPTSGPLLPTPAPPPPLRAPPPPQHPLAP